MGKKKQQTKRKRGAKIPQTWGGDFNNTQNNGCCGQKLFEKRTMECLKKQMLALKNFNKKFESFLSLNRNSTKKPNSPKQ